MPPTYKPLTTAGGIQGAPGLPAEIFAPPPNISFNQAEQINASLLAQELANQQTQIKTDQMQAMNQGLQQHFQGIPEDTYDPNKVMDVVARIALESGDANTGIAALRSQNFGGSGNVRLTPDQVLSLQQEGVPVDENDTVATARFKINARQMGAVQGRFDDQAPLRDLRQTQLEQIVTGTQVRPPTAAQVAKIGSGDAFIQGMERMEEKYMPFISENRGQRWAEMVANPNSAAARMQAELELRAKEAALSLEDRVTNQDFETLQNIVTVHPLDTTETIMDKMSELKLFIRRRNLADLNAMRAGGFQTNGLMNRNQNPDALAQQFGGAPTPGLNGGIGPGAEVPLATYGTTRTPEQRAIIEQIKAQKRAERGN